MKTTTSKIISKEIVKKVVTETTTTDENVVITLPKSVFTIKISDSDLYSYKKFLVIEYDEHDNWVNRFTLTNVIIKNIDNYTGRVIRQCNSCCNGYIALHYNDEPNFALAIKEDKDNYTILSKVSTVNRETSYKSLF